MYLKLLQELKKHLNIVVVIVVVVLFFIWWYYSSINNSSSFPLYEKELSLYRSLSPTDQQSYLNMSKEEKLVRFGQI